MRKADPALTAVWGFGSTFEENRPYRIDSDIDLAIEGGDLLKLFKFCEDSRFTVDLIDISNADDDFAKIVRKFGTSL